jgi:proteic killer suppression protein/toxin YoeB
VKISFINEKVMKVFEELENVPEKGNLLKKRVGSDMAKQIKKRYNQLKAYTTFEEMLKMPFGRPEGLTNSGTDYSLRLDANYRLIISPNCSKGDPEHLKGCTEIIIKGVVDYHGGKQNWIIP